MFFAPLSALANPGEGETAQAPRKNRETLVEILFEKN